MSFDVFLDGVPPRRRSAAVFEQLRSAIVEGRIEPGQRLPTSRRLAQDLGLSRSTVTTVYSRLVAEGHAEGRVGDGTYVAEHPGFIAVDGPGGMPRSAPESVSVGGSDVLPSEPVAVPHSAGRGHGEPSVGTAASGLIADLRSGRPDPSLFPLADWRRAVTAGLHEPPPGYGHPAGLPLLRQVIAAWIRRSRGVEVAADQVMITAGAQGAFDLCARALAGPGATVAVENPGYAPARRSFRAAGLTVEPVPVDGQGLVVDDVPSSARLVYVTPSHQSPTGVVLGSQRRRDLLSGPANMLIMEDDYDTEYRYVDRPLEPLFRLDRGHRVIYVGSFSKTLSPSLRLGFVVASRSVIEVLTAARATVDMQPPHLTQSALARFIADGAFERHLRRTGRVYRRRRDLVLDEVGRLHADGVVTSMPICPAGLHVTVNLPEDVDAAAVSTELSKRGVVVDSTNNNWMGYGRPGLILGFGLADNKAFTAACATLRTVLS